MFRRPYDLGRFDLILIDECFPAGTLITTPSGHKPIEEIGVDDLVMSALGPARVLATSARPSTNLVRLEFNDGSATTCTSNHRIFTDRGWIEAGSMEIGTCVFGREELCALWQCLPSVDLSSSGWIDVRVAGEILDKAALLLDILLKEVREPDAIRGGPQGSPNPTEGDALEADPSLRKWRLAVTSTIGLAPRPGAGMGAGMDDYHRSTKGLGASNNIQDRLGTSG